MDIIIGKRKFNFDDDVEIHNYHGYNVSIKDKGYNDDDEELIKDFICVEVILPPSIKVNEHRLPPSSQLYRDGKKSVI